MYQFVRYVLFVSLVLTWAMPSSLHAADTTFYFDDPEKLAVFRELTAELRCPMCQNQNIADSNAMIALDLKRKTYDLVQQGQSKQEVIDYMKARYGDFVHYHPPVTPVTVWLWLFPVLFVAFAIVMLIRARLLNADHANTTVNRAAGDTSKVTDNPTADPKLDANVSRADALMDKYK